jgi:hypothetical protein
LKKSKGQRQKTPCYSVKQQGVLCKGSGDERKGSSRNFLATRVTATATATAAAAIAISASAAATTAAVAAAATAATVGTAAATTATAVAATTAAIAAAAAAATRRTRFARTCFVNGQRPTFDGLAIELGDCLLRIRFARHRDKREAARFTGKLVLHQRDFLDRSHAGEHVLEVGFSAVEGKIPYV